MVGTQKHVVRMVFLMGASGCPAVRYLVQRVGSVRVHHEDDRVRTVVHVHHSSVKYGQGPAASSWIVVGDTREKCGGGGGGKGEGVVEGGRGMGGGETGGRGGKRRRGGGVTRKIEDWRRALFCFLFSC